MKTRACLRSSFCPVNRRLLQSLVRWRNVCDALSWTRVLSVEGQAARRSDLPAPGGLLFGSPWTGPGVQGTRWSPRRAGQLTAACAGRRRQGSPGVWSVSAQAGRAGGSRRPHQPQLRPPQRSRAALAPSREPSCRLPAGKRRPDRLCEGGRLL